MSNSNIFSPENHPTFHPSYSHVCSTPLHPTSRLITVAGQIGRGSVTNTTPSAFLEQVEIALKNVKTCLDAAGAKKTDIVMVRHYIVGIEGHDYKGRVERYMAWMEVAGLATKEMLYELEVMAVVSG
ncbi:hypothetical protein N431DRAFT_495815 [Stipitochalara longipes BDJ]|nr:hypothetical protein N431DRAFT_495815 [Stipitochalara longipes BDJ]